MVPPVFKKTFLSLALVFFQNYSLYLDYFWISRAALEFPPWAFLFRFYLPGGPPFLYFGPH